MRLLAKLRNWLMADLVQLSQSFYNRINSLETNLAIKCDTIQALWVKLAAAEREIEALKQRSENSDAALTEARGAMKFVTALRKELASLQALDMGFRETGKIIVIARVNNRDIVKIIDCPRNMAQNEYKAMVEMLERMYGAKLAYSDTPLGVDFTRTGE